MNNNYSFTIGFWVFFFVDLVFLNFISSTGAAEEDFIFERYLLSVRFPYISRRKENRPEQTTMYQLVFIGIYIEIAIELIEL